MTERGTRAARGILAAVLAVFVAALFHVAGGGAVPGALGVVVSLALAVPASVLLAGRRVSLWRLAASVVFSQLAFHVLFSLGRPSSVRLAADAPAGGMRDMSGMIMAGTHLSVVGGSGEAAADVSWLVPAMYAMHAMAALVTVAALYRGERTLARMLRLAALRLARAVRLAVPVGVPAAGFTPIAAPRALRPVAEVIGTLRHRGPPVRPALVTL